MEASMPAVSGRSGLMGSPTEVTRGGGNGSAFHPCSYSPSLFCFIPPSAFLRTSQLATI
jgi:hypothetical protein